MWLFDIFTDGQRAKRHKKKRAPSHGMKLAHQTREVTAAPSTGNSSPPNVTLNNPRRSDRAPTIIHYSEQPRSVPCGSTNNSRVTVDRIGTPSGRSVNSPQTDPLQRRSRQAKGQPLSSPSKRPTTSRGSVPIAHEREKAAKPTRSSSAASWKHGRTVTKEFKVIEAKQVNLRDHFPSPTEDPCNEHPAVRPRSPASSASSAPPALPPRPHVQSKSRHADNPQTGTVDDRSTGSSTGSSSPISARSSPCASAITEATTIVPEEAVPRNPQQEFLRQLSSVGFAVQHQVQYPVFGGVGKSRGLFEMSKQQCGCISHSFDSITRKGRVVLFPRKTTGTCDASRARSGD